MTFQVFWCRHCNAPEEIHAESLRERSMEFREWWLAEEKEDGEPLEGYVHTLSTCPGYEPKDEAAHAGELLASLARFSTVHVKSRVSSSSFDYISRLFEHHKDEMARRTAS